MRGLAFLSAWLSPMRPTFYSPRRRHRPQAPIGRGAERRYGCPSLRSGGGRPASATAPPLTRLGAACAGGWPFLALPSRLRCPRLGSGWNSLVRRLPDSLALRLGRCPRRKDRRGSSRRSAALLRPAFAGRASGGRARVLSTTMNELWGLGPCAKGMLPYHSL